MSMCVREYMKVTPTVPADATVARAAELMTDQGLPIIPIVADDDRFMGVITAEDARKLATDAVLMEFGVFHFMTSQQLVIDVNESIEAAARLFHGNPDADILVVLYNGRAKGLLMRDALPGAAFSTARSGKAQTALAGAEYIGDDISAVCQSLQACAADSPDSSVWLG